MNEYERWSVLLWLLSGINMKLEKIMTSQDDINADVTQIQGAVSNLGSAVTAIAAEIEQLKGQGVDTSGLDAAVGQLGTAVQGVQALVPPPTTTP